VQARDIGKELEGSEAVIKAIKLGQIEKLNSAPQKCEPLIDVNEAAELLEVHPKTVKRLAAKGVIPAMKIGKLWRFRASLLDPWMKSQLHLWCHPCSDAKGDE
jgi:excisionase family DNA binding protein